MIIKTASQFYETYEISLNGNQSKEHYRLQGSIEGGTRGTCTPPPQDREKSKKIIRVPL